MKRISEAALKKMLKKHERWLETNVEGPDSDKLDLRYDYIVLGSDPFNRPDLKGANLQYMNLQSVNLSFLKASESNLSYAWIRDSSLYAAELSNSILFGTNIQDTNFQDSILRNVDFRKATLGNIDFQRADLRGANFEGAEISFCNFDGALLEDCKGLPYIPDVISIPKDATNGDMLLEILRDKKDCLFPVGDDQMGMRIDMDWWTAKFTGGL